MQNLKLLATRPHQIRTTEIGGVFTAPNHWQIADQLFALVSKMDRFMIFDLDGVLLDASHRIKLYDQADFIRGKCKQDQIGQLDLDHYRSNTTADQVAQDLSMPLIALVHDLNAAGRDYAVCTARVMCQHTSTLLASRQIAPLVNMHRDGDHDHRKDHNLKVTKIGAMLTQDQRDRALFIDDCLANCKAIAAIGIPSIHVPYDQHWRSKLDIRELL